MGRTTNWQQIQQGAREAERSVARKKYNLVMVKARQVLEYMVKCMAERACVVGGDLPDTMDQLCEGQWVNRATKDNYYTIHILGDKTVYGGNNTTRDANQASQLPTQEACVFANEFVGGAGGRVARPSPAARSTSNCPAPRQSSGGGRSAPGRNGRRVPTRSIRSGLSRQGGPRGRRRRASSAVYILRLLIPVLFAILLIVVTRVFMLDKDREADKTTTAPTVTTAPAEAMPTLPPELGTEPEAESPIETHRIEGNSINVRSEPSINDRILVQLGNGTEVACVKRYGNDWAVINHSGREAYTSSKFIEKVEPMASTGGETGGSEARTDS